MRVNEILQRPAQTAAPVSAPQTETFRNSHLPESCSPSLTNQAMRKDKHRYAVMEQGSHLQL